MGYALFSGLLLSLTAPIADIGVLAWVGFVPMLFYVAHEPSMRKIIAAAVVTGAVYILAVLAPLLSLGAWWWMADDPFWYASRQDFLFLIILTVAITMGGGAFALFATLYKKMSAWRWWIAAPVAGVVWAGIERLQEVFVLGFTWGHVGYALHDTALLPAAALFGVYGLSALIMMVNVCFVFGLRALLSGKSLRNALPALMAPIVAIGLVGGYGGYVSSDEKNDGETRNVAVIHTGLKTEESTGLPGFRRTMTLLTDALSEEPDMVVLPENAIPFFVIIEETGFPMGYDNEGADIKQYFDEFTALSRAHASTSIVVGLPSRDGADEFNSFVVVENGEVAALSNKQELLPFAENPWFFNRGHVGVITKGASIREVATMHGSVAPFICSEIAYPRVSNGDAPLIVNISNDSIFDEFLASYQHHLIAKTRAAERRAYLLRSVKGGTSSIIDPYGRVVMTSRAPFEPEILRMRITLPR